MNMVFCTQCGARNEGDARFCTECGAPLATPPKGTPAPAGSAASTVPPSDGPGPATAAKRGWSRRLTAIVAAAVAAVLVAAGGVAGWLTYRAELWGGKTLPDPASLASQVASANGRRAGRGRTSGQTAVSAKAVTRALKAKGLKARTVREFSGRDPGSFLGYGNAAAGTRVKAGSTVTVRESAGPGVPKDTIGRPATRTVDTLRDMGVPVHYRQVVVSEDSRIPEGHVAVTSPAPGMPVAESQRGAGINVGVATHGKGVPLDIMGQDPDAATSALEAAGYTVKTTPHFSSKKYVGKVSGSYPAPGTTVSKGSSITLYVGADRSSTRDLTSKDYDGLRIASLQSSALIGMYCKETVTDPDRDCITLEQADGPLGGQTLQIKGHKPSNPVDALDLTNFSQADTGAMVEPDGVIVTDPDQLPMKNHLLLRNWGMFELYAGEGVAQCGSTPWADVTPDMYCDAGTVKPWDGNDWANMPTSTGVTYNMKDFLVYFPVGSDLSKLEASGYFDSASLAEARKQKPVDTTRPFIVYRDPSLYDKTSVPADSVADNPFVPTSDFDTHRNSLVPMKPAVSDATVYYLMEQDADLDWSSLPDATVAGAKPSADDDATLRKAMEQVAGDYMFSSGNGGWTTNLHVKADGTFSGRYQDTDLGGASAEHPRGVVRRSDFTGRFSSAQRNDDGSYALQCATGQLSTKGKIGDRHLENGQEVTIAAPYGMTPCDRFVFYPRGFDSTKLSETERRWSQWTDADYGNGGPLRQAALSNMGLNDDGKPSELTFFQKK